MPVALLLLELFAVTLFAADFNGIWTGVLTEPNRDPQDFSFRFTQTGSAITGKMYGDNESIPLKDVHVEGDRISFTVTTELNGQINKFVYSGTIHEGQLQLTRERQTLKAKDTPLQSLLLKRLTQ